jgi:hypothetical protein
MLSVATIPPRGDDYARSPLPGGTGVNGAGDTGHVNSAVYHGRVKSVAASRTDLQDIFADRCGSARSDSQ